MPGGGAAARAPHAALATLSRQAEIDRAAPANERKRRREDNDEGGGDNEDEEGSDDECDDDDDDDDDDEGEDEDDDDDDDEGDGVVHLVSSSDDDAPPAGAALAASKSAAVGMQAPVAKPTTASSATTKPSSTLTQTTIFGASAPSPKLAALKPSSKAGEALPEQARSYFKSKGLDMSTAVFSGDVRTLFGTEREDKTPCYLCNEWLDLRVNRVARMHQHLDGAKHAKVSRYLSLVVCFHVCCVTCARPHKLLHLRFTFLCIAGLSCICVHAAAVQGVVVGVIQGALHPHQPARAAGRHHHRQRAPILLR
jgi:hypothetical protein